MGYYLINNEDKTSNPFSAYVEKLEDLIYHIEGEVNDALIVAGSLDSAPFYLRDSDEYKNLCHEKFRNGLLAQAIFKEEARKQKFIVELVPQDSESFSDYNIIDSFTVKRADYVIKNCKDIEVEVKCLSFYTSKNRSYFYIRYHELMKLERMNSIIGKKTVLAIFDQTEVKFPEASLKMIELSTIFRENKKSVIYDKDTKCFKIPLELTSSGLDILENYRINKELYK
ncbi:hypothetical protein [Chryseobacterium rhizosphaerae]|uniref:YqaJ viral recombinase domain-containing protein n=1 Tax=Chryseobacterium rhizosphaerae TaxID=395937 RepID=A0ABX9IEK3_9FLAO|nr:hypothetical protein [Chryseobacterium rhizosphaerae]REC70969.1 hypothetical protein DRF57_21485 [Chryseobacterium rhizosphaerae]GEN69857.1 hypothetical protein CRH01_44250 [Chryseobacterium rhizosphaerae]